MGSRVGGVLPWRGRALRGGRGARGHRASSGSRMAGWRLTPAGGGCRDRDGDGDERRRRCPAGLPRHRPKRRAQGAGTRAPRGGSSRATTRSSMRRRTSKATASRSWRSPRGPTWRGSRRHAGDRSWSGHSPRASRLVTVTATNGAGSAAQEIVVVVSRRAPRVIEELRRPDVHTPEPPRGPPTSRTTSSATPRATVRAPSRAGVVHLWESDGRLTLTPLAAGSTTVTAWSTNSGGTASADLRGERETARAPRRWPPSTLLPLSAWRDSR